MKLTHLQANVSNPNLFESFDGQKFPEEKRTDLQLIASAGESKEADEVRRLIRIQSGKYFSPFSDL